MEENKDKTEFFCEYYAKWISVYKEGAIREVTLEKYKMTQKWLMKHQGILILLINLYL